VELVANTFPKKSRLGLLLEGCASQIIESGFDFKEVLPKRDLSNKSITVIMRTQGKRIEALNEALLCLSAQTNTDFDICLVGHKVSPMASKDIQEAVNQLPTFINSRLRYIEVNEGGRSHPLNVALSLLSSDYFVALDDDDLVFDNFIEAFVKGIRNNTGSAIHSGVFTQEWEYRNGAACSLNWPKPDYCDAFDAILQLNENHCPIMSLAFPSYLVNQFGLYYDETLSTLEDWDFIYRATQLCGVFESGANTSIYRLWKSAADTSHSLHSEEEWEDNRVQILQKMNQYPLLLPSECLELITDSIWLDAPVPLSSRGIAITGFRDSEPFPLSFGIRYDTSVRENCIQISDVNTVDSISIVLREAGIYSLDNLVVKIIYSDMTTESLDQYDVQHNGYSVNDDTISFLRRYSWFSISPSQAKSIDKILCYFAFRNCINEDLLSGTKIKVRLKQRYRKIRHHLHKLLSTI